MITIRTKDFLALIAQEGWSNGVLATVPTITFSYNSFRAVDPSVSSQYMIETNNQADALSVPLAPRFMIPDSFRSSIKPFTRKSSAWRPLKISMATASGASQTDRSYSVQFPFPVVLMSNDPHGSMTFYPAMAPIFTIPNLSASAGGYATTTFCGYAWTNSNVPFTIGTIAGVGTPLTPAQIVAGYLSNVISLKSTDYTTAFVWVDNSGTNPVAWTNTIQIPVDTISQALLPINSLDLHVAVALSTTNKSFLSYASVVPFAQALSNHPIFWNVDYGFGSDPRGQPYAQSEGLTSYLDNPYGAATGTVLSPQLSIPWVIYYPSSTFANPSIPQLTAFSAITGLYSSSGSNCSLQPLVGNISDVIAPLNTINLVYNTSGLWSIALPDAPEALVLSNSLLSDLSFI